MSLKIFLALWHEQKLHRHPKDTTQIKIMYNYKCCSNSYSESPKSKKEKKKKKKTGTILNLHP